MTDIIAKVTLLLRSANIDAGALSIRELGTGGNNRIYRLQCQGGRFALKEYFSHPGDRRDRLGAECGILRYLESAHIGNVPRCIHYDTRDQLALFSWLDGARPDVVTVRHVQSAGALFARMNAQRQQAEGLPVASDASFSVAEALEGIERRMGNLMHVSRGVDVDREAARLVDEMMRLWPDIKYTTMARAREADIDAYEELQPAERCLSPSDFGLHNALRHSNGELNFLDFEYAGWDDPAHMLADFFCQPAVPVSLRYWDLFIQTALAQFPDRERIAARAQVLLPAMQLRWCAIALNGFLPISGARRRFARHALDEGRDKLRQLRMAQSMFSRMAA